MFESYKNPVAQRSGGFTLIEVLVVIAVLSVLLAVLLPGLNLARRQALRSTCQAKLKGIALAWKTYLNDNDDQFYQRINANILYGGWRSRNPVFKKVRRPLNGYLVADSNELPSSPAAAKAFQCPADDGGLNGGGVPCYESVGTSYQTNVLLIGQDHKGWLPSDELLQKINARLTGMTAHDVSTSESDLLLIGDYGWANCWEPAVDAVGSWHGRGCHHNLAFLDGHVAFLHIRKGLYVTGDYTVLPFAELRGLAHRVQQEERCEDRDR